MLSVPVSIVLLLVYVGVTLVSLRRHRQLHTSDEPAEMPAWSLQALACSCSRAATVVTAFVAETLVHTLEVVRRRRSGSREFFVAAVIVAIVGNAAEHGGAVVVAYRGKLKLAAEIALASSAQVAVFLIPAVALLSWLIEPLALSFRPVEIAVLAGSVVFTAALLWQGHSSRARGIALIAAYVRRRNRVLHRRRPLTARGSVSRTLRESEYRLAASAERLGAWGFAFPCLEVTVESSTAAAPATERRTARPPSPSRT